MEGTSSVFTTADFEELFDILDLFRHFDLQKLEIQRLVEDVPFEADIRLTLDDFSRDLNLNDSHNKP